MKVREFAGVRVLVCADDGPPLVDDRALSDLIAELYSAGAKVAAVPLSRLGPDVLRLSPAVAGQVLQKLVNDQFRVVALGDIAGTAADRAPLGDFIRESNRGTTLWFVDDLAALEAKLASG
ncbi:MAG TPA: DUF4180 domain-containing protein [Phenylobacterium sp.]|jgi:hypothetical protein|nr:DUF4180 domain-containing protein [Phenylobacterium sp.]